jgi:hypothetical protein
VHRHPDDRLPRLPAPRRRRRLARVSLTATRRRRPGWHAPIRAPPRARPHGSPSPPPPRPSSVRFPNSRIALPEPKPRPERPSNERNLTAHRQQPS